MTLLTPGHGNNLNSEEVVSLGLGIKRRLHSQMLNPMIIVNQNSCNKPELQPHISIKRISHHQSPSPPTTSPNLSKVPTLSTDRKSHDATFPMMLYFCHQRDLAYLPHN